MPSRGEKLESHCVGRMSKAVIATILVLGIGPSAARVSHGDVKPKHGHTYLHICADAAGASSHVCLHRVKNTWPHSAIMVTDECAEAVRPHQPLGTTVPSCGPSGSGKNIFDPLTVPIGLMKAPGNYHIGADVDTFTDWDRIKCRDGHLFATGYVDEHANHPFLPATIHASTTAVLCCAIFRQLVYQIHAARMRSPLLEDQRFLRQELHPFHAPVDQLGHLRASRQLRA